MMQSADDEFRAAHESANELVHLPWESIDPDETNEPTTALLAPPAPAPVPVLALRARKPPQPQPTPLVSGGWTIPILCAGIGLIACCLIIPQVDVNRRAAYKKLSLERDLASIKQQVAVNDEFLKRVGDDPTLAERLAQRQMNIVKEGSRVWRDPLTSAAGADAMSPFQIVDVPPPAPLPPYQPAGGAFAAACLAPRSQLYLTGVGLLMLAAGLVLGGVARE
jgi:hypothetical protein